LELARRELARFPSAGRSLVVLETMGDHNKKWAKAIAASLVRLKMAVFGAFTLLAPMLIMTLHPTKLTVLLTTTIFVLVVASGPAAAMKTAENKDVIAACSSSSSAARARAAT